MENIFILKLMEDALFTAMAAIGFSSISHTPRQSWIACALAAAAGHSLRLYLTSPAGGSTGFVTACAVAAFCVGLVAVCMAPVVKVPAEACLFPALLPMIPGMFAYRSVEAVVGCLAVSGEEYFSHWLYLLNYNLFTCVAIVLAMVIGANLPIFILQRLSLQASR